MLEAISGAPLCQPSGERKLQKAKHFTERPAVKNFFNSFNSEDDDFAIKNDTEQ